MSAENVPQSDESDAGILREIAEALSGALTDRPQRCGHSSDPMCCPFENFPTLAEFFTSVTPPERTEP